MFASKHQTRCSTTDFGRAGCPKSAVLQRFSGMTEAHPSSGARLVEELSKPGDPFDLTLLIEDAGQIADFIERLRPVLRGDRDAWLEVNIGAKTVEVVVSNPLVQYRQLSEQLRKLLVTINGRRGGSGGPGDIYNPTKV